MNRIFTIFALLASLSLFAQTNVDISTGDGYAYEVYYSITDESSSSSERLNWDLAFATDNFDVNIHANNGSGVMVYTYPNGDLTSWDNIDTAGMYEWPAMYNSIEDMNMGALLRNAIPGDDFDYGWGQYNMTNHQITGDSLFIIKTVGGMYKKLLIENRNPMPGTNSWSIKFADLDGANEQSVTLSADEYSDKNMFHYSIDNSEIIDKEPATADWDLLFTRYYDYSIPYIVTGVLANSNRVMIQQVGEVEQDIFEDYTESEFNTIYNEIGSDWKTFNMSSFQYDIDSTVVYFAKIYNNDASDSTYWKLYFTGFSGSTGGTYSFTQKNITDASSVEEINALELFEIYPNPSNHYIQLITDAQDNMEYRLSDLSGKTILTGELIKGFNQESINVSNLQSGVYIISILSEGRMSSKKFIKE